MTIPIRKITMPTISITGRTMTDHGLETKFRPTTYTFTPTENKIVISADGMTVTQQEALVFYDSAKVTITAPYGFYDYNANADQEFVGSAMVDGNVVGKHGEIYYTINGKDPTRTKKYLWQNRARYFRHNTSGTDNVVLKARMYYRGEMSDVMTVEFRVVRPDESIVNNIWDSSSSSRSSSSSSRSSSSSSSSSRSSSSSSSSSS